MVASPNRRMRKRVLLLLAIPIRLWKRGLLLLAILIMGYNFWEINQMINIDMENRQPAQRSPIIVTKRLINDKTLPWDTSMARPWLEYYNNSSQLQSRHPPPVMILMTDIGWNQKKRSMGLARARFMRETELFTGVVNHPWFHPTAWDNIRSNRMVIRNDVRYYVFADVLQCREKNYPIYRGGMKNSDSSHNRTTEYMWPLVNACGGGIRKILQHRLLDATKNTAANAKLIIFNCQGDGWGKCAKETKHLPISIAAMSATFNMIDEDRDQGLIPPAPTTISLSSKQEEEIRSCEAESKRDFKMLYVGNYRSGFNKNHIAKHGGARGSYEKLHDNKSIIIRQKYPPNEIKESVLANLTYPEFMGRTIFGLAPRGDNKFSYRFTEVLSAGAIPIYHGDDFVFPFRPELVDWNKCAIILPEKDAGKTTLDLINDIPIETRCKMRNYCYFGIYKKYVETDVGIIDGLVMGLEELAKGNKKPFPGVRCNSTSVANFDCNNMTYIESTEI